MKNIILTSIVVLITFLHSQAQRILLIKDANFKAALLAQTPSIDLNNDKEIQVSEAQSVLYLNLSNKSIMNLIEIKEFTALTHLSCYNNQLTTLDVSNNKALKELHCNINQLTSLDVTKNTALTLLDCINNPTLSCIQALNSQDKTKWYKDNSAEYNENCNSVTNISNDEESTQPKTISIIYNLQGQSVNNTYKGLVIIRYTDGTSEKVIQ